MCACLQVLKSYYIQQVVGGGEPVWLWLRMACFSGCGVFRPLRHAPVVEAPNQHGYRDVFEIEQSAHGMIPRVMHCGILA